MLNLSFSFINYDYTFLTNQNVSLIYNFNVKRGEYFKKCERVITDMIRSGTLLSLYEHTIELSDNDIIDAEFCMPLIHTLLYGHINMYDIIATKMMAKLMSINNTLEHRKSFKKVICEIYVNKDKLQVINYDYNNGFYMFKDVNDWILENELSVDALLRMMKSNLCINMSLDRYTIEYENEHYVKFSLSLTNEEHKLYVSNLRTSMLHPMITHIGLVKK